MFLLRHAFFFATSIRHTVCYIFYQLFLHSFKYRIQADIRDPIACFLLSSRLTIRYLNCSPIFGDIVHSHTMFLDISAKKSATLVPIKLEKCRLLYLSKEVAFAFDVHPFVSRSCKACGPFRNLLRQNSRFNSM